MLLVPGGVPGELFPPLNKKQMVQLKNNKWHENIEKKLKLNLEKFVKMSFVY